jgi:hypothetical protein
MVGGEGSLVPPSGREVADEMRRIAAESGAWSPWSITSCDGGEARLEVERAAGASGVDL